MSGRLSRSCGITFAAPLMSAAQPGQFILTGSAVPADDITRHTGAGRIVRIAMRPMSLFESAHSTGTISLAGLLDAQPVRSPDSGLTVAALADRVCVGGWPAFQRLSVDEALSAVSSYLDEIRRTDINRIDGSRRDPDRVGKLLRQVLRAGRHDQDRDAGGSRGDRRNGVWLCPGRRSRCHACRRAEALIAKLRSS